MDTNHTKPYDVYVFGAGASKHVGAPLANEFVEEGFNRAADSKLWSVNRQTFMDALELIDIVCSTTLCQTLEDAPTDLMPGMPLDRKPWANIEELLTFVQSAIDNGETWRDFPYLRDCLHDFIFQTLHSGTELYDGGVYIPTKDGLRKTKFRNCYDDLIEQAVRMGNNSAFVSFNYDVFLDDALFDASRESLPNYAIAFSTVERGYTMRQKSLEQAHRTPWTPLLLKLHGSLNWAQCSSCNATHLTSSDDYRGFSCERCAECGESRLAPMLAAPSYRKALDIEKWKSVWAAARDILIEAVSITIVGYSFPQADFEARWLFLSSLIHNSNRPLLRLVDPSCEVRKRLRCWFEPWAGSIEEHKSFEEYVRTIQSR